MNYYESLIEKVESLIHEKNYEKAYSILQDELNMPYIPSIYEGRLQALSQVCQTTINSQRPAIHLDEEAVEARLFGSVEDAYRACEWLRQSNIRAHLPLVQKYLSMHPHYLIRPLLLEIMMEQDIHDSITIQHEGLQIECIPSYCEAIQERETTIKMIEYFDAYFGNDNPTLLQMCVETLLKELYLRLPLSIEEDEMMYVVNAIITYVMIANFDDKVCQTFISEKNLAKYSGYDLLLYKYNI